MRLFFLNARAMVALVFQQMTMQQRIIELQDQVIELQRELDGLKPKNPKDKDVFWHLHSGMGSTEAANSKDLEVLRRFKDWNVEFAEKYIKPYVNPKVFSECLNQMTRGLPERIAEAQTKKDLPLWSSNPCTEEDKKVKLTIVQ